MPPKPLTKFAPRKLLVAAVGVASLNYIAVACTPPTAGNAAPPSAPGTSVPPTAGNLPAPIVEDAATPTPKLPPPTSGNLMVPPPEPDTGKVDAGKRR